MPATNKSPAVPAAPASLTPRAAQGNAALLVELASGVASAEGGLPSGHERNTGTTPDAGDATAKTEARNDDPQTAAPASADPLAASAAVLPALVVMPIVVAEAAAMKAQAEPMELAAARGDAALATASGTRSPGLAGNADPAIASQPAEDAVVTFVASSAHLAPVTTLPASAVPHTAAADAQDARKAAPVPLGGNTAAPAAPAATGAASRDVTPAAAPSSHAEAAAPLPDGTLQSIATAVRSLAADAAAPAGGAAPAAPAAAAGIGDPAPTLVAPARSLTLQLTSGNLGSVTVRLHLAAGGLDVHLAVDDRTTLASLSHARDELATAIGGNGYRVESLVIGGADASSTSTAGSHDSARSQTEAGTGQGSSGGSSGGAGGDASSSRRRAPSAAPRDVARARGDGGVFV